MTPQSLTNLEVLPVAIRETHTAWRWYASRSQNAAARFRVQVEQAMVRIVAAPESWTVYLYGTRAYRLRRFPYLVVFKQHGSTITVIAVANTYRRPGYWRRRMKTKWPNE